MADSPQIAAMGRTLVDCNTDLSSDRTVILCLIGAGYDACDIQNGIDLAIVFAQRIHDARASVEFDPALRKVADIMRAG